MRLLLTRPEPDAQRTAAALRAQGHDVIIAPLLRIEPAADAEIGAGPWAAVLITSANAAHAVTAHARVAPLRALPVFAVGRRSADAMARGRLRRRDVRRRRCERSGAARRHATAAGSPAPLSRRRRSLRRSCRRSARPRLCRRDHDDLSRHGRDRPAALRQPMRWPAASTACCTSPAAAPRPMSTRRGPQACSPTR